MSAQPRRHPARQLLKSLGRRTGKGTLRWAGPLVLGGLARTWRIEVLGEEAATEWARGVAANLARAPQGGDRDQIRAVAAGECLVGVSNTYYWGALMASDNPEDRAAAEAVGIIFPNQSNRGTHVNLSGAGVVKTAPNPENAVRFIEFLTSDAAQVVLADSNNEYPVVATVKPTGPIAAYADFRPSGVNAEIFGINAARATAIYDRAGMP